MKKTIIVASMFVAFVGVSVVSAEKPGATETEEVVPASEPAKESATPDVVQGGETDAVASSSDSEEHAAKSSEKQEEKSKKAAKRHKTKRAKGARKSKGSAAAPRGAEFIANLNQMPSAEVPTTQDKEPKDQQKTEDAPQTQEESPAASSES